MNSVIRNDYFVPGIPFNCPRQQCNEFHNYYIHYLAYQIMEKGESCSLALHLVYNTAMYNEQIQYFGNGGGGWGGV